MKILHDIPLLNICGPATSRRLNTLIMVDLSRLGLRAKMSVRATSTRAVNIRSKLSQLYAIAISFISRIETSRAPTRGIGQVRLAGLDIW